MQVMNVARRYLPFVAVAAMASGLAANPCSAQDASPYPSRPVRIVVGFPPGGPTDRLAREIAAGLHEAWHQPVIVENRPGAGSRIAFEQVARSEPDGYTLLVAALQTATNVAVYRKLNYDTLRDFAPVTQLTSTVLVLAASPTFASRTLGEAVAAARASPQ